MTVDVFFAGLMIICLESQPSCLDPMENYGNTAWVVKADGVSTPCGRKSPEETQLEMIFEITDFELRSQFPFPYCCTLGEDAETVTCVFEGVEDLCLASVPVGHGRLEKSLRRLPRIDEIDRRFKDLDMHLLTNRDYVPTRIHFHSGVTGAGPVWSPGTQWFRSDGSSGGLLPRELSDRIKVSYQASEIRLTDCGGGTLSMTLVPKPNRATYEVMFRNRAKERPIADQVEEKYDDLAYLLWYYRLGLWDTESGECPEYSDDRKDAVLLRCERKDEDGCAWDPSLKADTTMWPSGPGTVF